MLDESFDAGRFDVWHEIEAIDRSCDEPRLDRVRELFRTANDESVPGDDAVQQLSNSKTLTAC